MPVVSKDYRTVNSILRDLRSMYRELVPENDTELQASKERVAKFARTFDTFAQKKYALNHILRDLRTSVRHCEMQKRREAKYKDFRSPETIQMISRNETDILDAMEKTKELSLMWQIDMKKKKRGVSAKVLEDRACALQLIGQELDTLYQRNSRTADKKIGSLQKESVLPPPDSNVLKMQAQFRKNTREHAMSKKRSVRVAGEAAWGRDLTENEKQFAARVEFIHQEQNKLLYDVGSGLRELKHASEDMAATLVYQKVLTTDIGKEIAMVDDGLDISNEKLKNIMDRSGGAGLWCTRIVCFVFLCTLIASLVSMIIS